MSEEALSLLPARVMAAFGRGDISKDLATDVLAGLTERDQLAARVRDLEAALQAAQKDGWISVDDRLPDFNALVLCWLTGLYEHGPGMTSPRSGMAEMVRHRDSHMLGEWGAMFYQQAEKKIGATVAEVTHWQPLPPPPLATNESGDSTSQS